jgi:hypothetical protein
MAAWDSADSTVHNSTRAATIGCTAVIVLATSLLTGKGKFVVLHDPPSLHSSLSVGVRLN